MKIKINLAALFRSLEVCLSVQTGSKVVAEEKKGLRLLRIRHHRTDYPGSNRASGFSDLYRRDIGGDLSLLPHTYPSLVVAI